MNTHTTSEKIHTLTCRDGLTLVCRDIGPSTVASPPILCLPGLTRNSKDFLPLARRYAEERRFLCPDLRGRGLSDWDGDLDRYRPDTYVEDVWEWLAYLGVERVAIIGTSLGGLMAMIMGTTRPQAVAGIIFNDIGPDVIHEGIERIMGYIGLLPPVENWDEAVRQYRQVYEIAYPNLDEATWVTLTKRQYRADADGVPKLEYDPKLGEALRTLGGLPIDPWELFESLDDTLPMLLLRGAVSDIFSKEIADKMAILKPRLEQIIVADRGHVPLLDEPECVPAIDAFLAAVS